MSRGVLTIDDVDHDLTHLSPFTFNVTPKVDGAPTYKVLVSFGHHTFTRKFEQGVDNPAYIYSEQGDVRCFCPDRYLASKGLPGLIATATKGKAYFSHGRDFMIIDQPLGGDPYVVFFNIEPTRKVAGIHASMFVVSAYVKPGLPSRSRLPAISFATLVSKVVSGQNITRPKK